MGRSPKNVRGDRGGCKGAFIQTAVGMEAGDDRSDLHTFRILGDLRLKAECFPAGPLPPHRQGHRRARRIHSQLSDTCPVVAGIFLPNHLFVMKRYYLSLASSTVCSHIVLLSWGLSGARRLGDMLGTHSQTAEVPTGQESFLWKLVFIGGSPYTRTPRGTQPGAWPGALGLAWDPLST